MKNSRPALLVVALIALAVIATAECAEEKNPGTAENASATPGVPPTTPAPEATTKWSDIKDTTYDLRANFFSGLKAMASRVDAQVAELTARRRAMTSATDTKEWDFAMKEMIEARAYFKSTGEMLAKATVETWTQERDKVGQAWDRTQTAYAKVKASTTG